MAKVCSGCGRPRHTGLCDMAELSDGRIVHVSRIDRQDGDIRAEIVKGQVQVRNRWIKKKREKDDASEGELRLRAGRAGRGR